MRRKEVYDEIRERRKENGMDNASCGWHEQLELCFRRQEVHALFTALVEHRRNAALAGYHTETEVWFFTFSSVEECRVSPLPADIGFLKCLIALERKRLAAMTDDEQCCGVSSCSVSRHRVALQGFQKREMAKLSK